jgi:hypothetical protein
MADVDEVLMINVFLIAAVGLVSLSGAAAAIPPPPEPEAYSPAVRWACNLNGHGSGGLIAGKFDATTRWSRHAQVGVKIEKDEPGLFRGGIRTLGFGSGLYSFAISGTPALKSPAYVTFNFSAPSGSGTVELFSPTRSVGMGECTFTTLQSERG